MTRRRKVLDEMLLNRNNDGFLKELSSDPKETAQALRLLLSFFRDVLLLKCGVSKDGIDQSGDTLPIFKRTWENLPRGALRI